MTEGNSTIPLPGFNLIDYFLHVLCSIEKNQAVIIALGLRHHRCHRITTRFSRPEHVGIGVIHFLLKYIRAKDSINRTSVIMHTFKHLQILPLLMSTLRATLSNRHRTDENCMGAKVGIIGCGRWGSVHIKTLFQLKQEGLISEIHGCDINPQKGDEFADLLTTFSTDWQELVSRETVSYTHLTLPTKA